MPRIVNGVIQPKSKKKGYSRIDQDCDDNHDGSSNTQCCTCCKDMKADCNECNVSCGSFTFHPAMLLSMEAFVGYAVVLSAALITYFASWQIGLSVFIICGIAYGLFLYYRCCGGAANGNRSASNGLNPNRRGGIMGVADLPKERKGG